MAVETPPGLVVAPTVEVVAGGQGGGVAVFHPKYSAHLAKWKRCRDVIAGRDAVHAATVAYLPMLKGQTEADYRAMLMRSPFYNASWRTVAAFIGLLFRKPPTLEVSATVKKLLEDVTMSGVSFDTLAQDVALEDLTVSRAGLLVDYPSLSVDADGKPIERTKAEAERLGVRPSIQLYEAETIRNHKKRKVGNRVVLSQVRLTENEHIEKGEFETETELRIRVLDLDPQGYYRQRVYKEANGQQVGKDIYPLMNGERLTYIPFYFIGPDGTDSEYEEPVLIDLFDTNLDHFRASSDYENACHITALPTPWVTGYTPTVNEATGEQEQFDFHIGYGTALVFTNPDAKVGFLEYEGGGINAIEKNLTRKEAQMAAIGSRIISPEKSGVEAAATLVIRSAGENSVLAAVAIAVSSGLSAALVTFSLWAGDSEAVAKKAKYVINRDFVPLNADPQQITAWLALVQAGLMSPESLFDLLQRADLQSSELTFEQEQARIDAAPTMPEPVAPPNAKPGAEGEQGAQE
jgi:hypothetical protein